MDFLLSIAIPTAMSLNDLEQRNNRYFVFFHRIR